MDAIRDSAVASYCTSIERDDRAIVNYKDVVLALNNNVKGVQNYQLFSARNANPGVLECHRTPSLSSDMFDLRKSIDGKLVTAKRALELFSKAKPVQPPPVDLEKLVHIRASLHLYVPAEYEDDELYRAPRAEEEDAGRAMRKSRIAAEAVRKMSIAAAAASATASTDTIAGPPAKKQRSGKRAQRMTVAPGELEDGEEEEEKTEV